jgi:hypothetical protein
MDSVNLVQMMLSGDGTDLLKTTLVDDAVKDSVDETPTPSCRFVDASDQSICIYLFFQKLYFKTDLVSRIAIFS